MSFAPQIAIPFHVYVPGTFSAVDVQAGTSRVDFRVNNGNYDRTRNQPRGILSRLTGPTDHCVTCAPIALSSAMISVVNSRVAARRFSRRCCADDVLVISSILGER